MDLKEIFINCKYGELTLKQIIPLQGKLKSLSEENFNRLKKSMIDNGFIMPFSVWENKNKCLDGHQRLSVLSRLAEEGYKLPHKFPVIFVKADSEKKAIKMLLSLVSQFGIVSKESMLNFANENDISFHDLEDYRIPDIDMSEVFKEESILPLSDSEMDDLLKKDNGSFNDLINEEVYRRRQLIESHVEIGIDREIAEKLIIDLLKGEDDESIINKCQK